MKWLLEATAHSRLRRLKRAHALAAHMASTCRPPALPPPGLQAPAPACDTCPAFRSRPGQRSAPPTKARPRLPATAASQTDVCVHLPSAPPPHWTPLVLVLCPPLPRPHPGGARTLEGSAITCAPAPDAHALAPGPGAPHAPLGRHGGTAAWGLRGLGSPRPACPRLCRRRRASGKEEAAAHAEHTWPALSRRCRPGPPPPRAEQLPPSASGRSRPGQVCGATRSVRPSRRTQQASRAALRSLHWSNTGERETQRVLGHSE